MRSVVALLIGCLLAAPAVAAEPPAIPRGTPVDVALVLVSDVSRSINDGEFELQKRGYTAAFTNDDVIAAIRGGTYGAVAVAYVEFASAGEARTVLDWTLIRDGDGARAFARRLADAPRSFWGRTAIGNGMAVAIQDLAAASVRATRRVIDVCGDGTNNAGQDVATVRDQAVAADITVNGLTIINDHAGALLSGHVHPPGGLTEYYRRNVTGGPDSFVMEVHDFETFGTAMTRKLVNEIAALPEPSGRDRL